MAESLSTRVNSIETSPIRKLIDMVDKIPNVIGLHAGEPDFDTPMHIIEAAKKALNEGHTHYTHTAGLPELREAIAEKLLKENNIKADPETEITVTVGGFAALFSTFQTVINPADEVIVTEPSWPSYEGFIKLSGGIPVHLQLKAPDYPLDVNSLKEKITEHTKMVVINNPNNPTGAVYSKKELKVLASLAKKHGFLVLADEVYEKIVFDNTHHYSIASLTGMKEKTITVNSFSKTYAMTGWRIGYVVSNEKITTGIRRIHSYAVSCVSPAFQKAALTALTAPNDCVQQMVRKYKERRDITVEALNDIPGLQCIKPKGTFYLFPDVQGLGLPSANLAEQMLKKAKVATIPGSAFGPSGEGHLRMSISVSKKDLLEAVKRIKSFVRTLPSRRDR
ncbi:MAG: pyridoxal phosphate-dependent aminotransferase [Candidatus Bathyarchaeota archaeon]|nr:pyridoxal phosphate-dependent aminotransferase [Candidatus Bathyarchaeota archaeon]